jgi:hypothetical protein
METHFICFLFFSDSIRKVWQCYQLKMNSTGRTWEYQKSHQTAFFLSNLLNSLRMTSTEDDDEVGHFILRFSSSPTSSSPPAAAATTKTTLIDQFLVIHAIAWLVVDEFDLFHLFLVINGLQEFVADRTDFNHDL